LFQRQPRADDRNGDRAVASAAYDRATGMPARAGVSGPTVAAIEDENLRTPDSWQVER
jgi:hypothetical protein